jgi:hypothetical protein
MIRNKQNPFALSTGPLPVLTTMNNDLFLHPFAPSGRVLNQDFYKKPPKVRIEATLNITPKLLRIETSPRKSEEKIGLNQSPLPT